MRIPQLDAVALAACPSAMAKLTSPNQSPPAFKLQSLFVFLLLKSVAGPPLPILGSLVSVDPSERLIQAAQGSWGTAAVGRSISRSVLLRKHANATYLHSTSTL